MDTLESKTIDYKGREFSDFYPARSSSDGPGWYVFGRNPGYGGHLIMLCGRPAIKARKHPHYNIKVRRGFKTKREAQQWANAMNIFQGADQSHTL